MTSNIDHDTVGRTAILCAYVAFGLLAFPSVALAADQPSVTVPATAYDGTLMEVVLPDEGELRVQYAIEGDFDLLVDCDTGWFHLGFHLGVQWTAPARMNSSYEVDPCDDLESGVYAIRAKYRDASLEESEWSEVIVFAYSVDSLVRLSVPVPGYDGATMSVSSADATVGDFQVQYSDEEDFASTLLCDTGWLDSGVQSSIEWELPNTFDSTFDPTPCSDLDFGTYRVRARFRDGITESPWSEEVIFDYLGSSPEQEAAGDPSPLPDPPAPEHRNFGPLFGGWWTSREGNGITIRGTRASITIQKLDHGADNQPNSFGNARVSAEIRRGEASGLIQTGVFETNGFVPCGGTNPYSYSEWKQLSTSETNFVCDQHGPHGYGTSKRYAVQRVGNCGGCWIAKINGSQVGSVHSLGSTIDDFGDADLAGATSEFFWSADDSARGQELAVRWGKTKASQRPWQRTASICTSASDCGSTTWTTISAPDICSNTDDHFQFKSIFNQSNGFVMWRWVRNGSPNDNSC